MRNAMDNGEKNNEILNEGAEGESSFEPSPAPRKYVDRSGDAVTDGQSVAEGAVWQGPAFEASDAEAERQRVRAIIEKNVQGLSAEADANLADEESYEEAAPQEEKRESFLKSGWFAVLCSVILPPLGIALLWRNKKLAKGVKVGMTVVGSAIIAGALFLGYRSFRAHEDAKIRAEAEALLAQQRAEEEAKAKEEAKVDEDAIKAEQFPHSSAYPTPTEFFTSKTAYSDYQYYYVYSQGIVAGYDSYQGTDIITLMTKYGYLKLLGTTFTIPKLNEGDVYYFYYLYLGYDTSNDAVFGMYVDYSAEDEGAGREQFASYADGTYAVGTDIPAGEYFFYPNGESATVGLYGDDKFIEKIFGETFEGGCFVTVKEGQVLDVKGAKFAQSDTIALSSGNTLYPSVYRIGIDVEAGSYRLSVDGTGEASYRIYDGSDPQTRQLIDTDSFDRQVIITVEDGQYVQLINCTGAKYTGAVPPTEGSDGSSDAEA